METEKQLSPEELIEILRDKVKDEGANPAKCAVNIGDLRELLAALPLTETTLTEITKDAILDLLKNYGENNPEGGGLMMPFIWRQLMGKIRVSNIDIEQAITELLQEDKIDSIREGVTYYRIAEPGDD